MLRKIRKHNKWLMVGFGVLLMVVWLIQPALEQFNSAWESRVVAKLNGKKITARQMSEAYKEVSAIRDLLPVFAQNLGLADRDSVHWLLLATEAKEAGVVGGPAEGQDWEAVTQSLAMRNAFSRFRDFAPQIINNPQLFQQLVEEARPQTTSYIRNAASGNQMSEQAVLTALAKARGIVRMLNAYQGAARMSDRRAIQTAQEYLSSAKANYVFIPAERLIDSIPDPEPAVLQAHFDQYKSVKPGEGEYGIGYLLPPRVKIEYLKIDRAAIESAVSLDPIEVRKRYNQGKGTTYPGEFATERVRIEAEMKGEVVDKVVQEAHVAIQTEILKATKVLEPDGKFKKLPADWESKRPRFENIAPAVVEAVRRATGTTIPLPPVTVKAGDWLTRRELQQLPEIGRAELRAGGFQVPFDQVVFWARELGEPGDALLPIQTGVPVSESFLADGANNRYYFTVLAVKGESSPDSIDEQRAEIVKDFKSIKAFEQLKTRVDELRSKAVSGGLEAIVSEFPAATPPDPASPPAEAKYKALDIAKDVTVHTETASQFFGTFDPVMSAEGVAEKVIGAASQIDPLLPPEQVPVDAATLAIPIPKSLGVAVVRIIRPDPLTTEEFRRFDMAVVQTKQSKELAAVTEKPEDSPFSFQNLLRRHTYTSGDKSIRTPEDLKND